MKAGFVLETSFFVFTNCFRCLFYVKSAPKNESTCVGHRKYFHWRLRVLSSAIASMFIFRGSFLPVHDNYWMSFLFDLVSPPSGCGFQIQFYRTAIIQFTPPMKTSTFVFPFRIPFFFFLPQHALVRAHTRCACLTCIIKWERSVNPPEMPLNC